MKFIPILFSTEMVRAILAGEKTQTRRIVKSKEPLTSYEGVMTNRKDFPFWKEELVGTHIWLTEEGEFLKKPKAKIGDVFWVRETWQQETVSAGSPLGRGWNATGGYVYRSDGTTLPELSKAFGKWKPSIFMPKDACRIFLEVVNVRVEQVQDISEQDSIDEGVIRIRAHNDEKRIIGYPDYTVDPKHGFNTVFTAKESFETLWESINGRESWDYNPFVWVYEFKIIEKPKEFNL